MPARLARILLAVFLLPTLVAAQRPSPPSGPYRFGYHSYAESTALLNELAARHPALATLSSIGKSATGLRELWCMTLTNRATGAPDTKPAVYYDGNHHAAEPMGGEVTLHLIHYLLARYGTDPDVTRLLDTRVVYVVQRADPDGAEAFMTGKTDWAVDKVVGARDVDGDGRKGEDGPDDANGDGEVMRMRIADPKGDWKPVQPRRAPPRAAGGRRHGWPVLPGDGRRPRQRRRRCSQRGSSHRLVHLEPQLSDVLEQ